MPLHIVALVHGANGHAGTTRYVPSVVERAWMGGSVTHGICNLATSGTQIEAARLWLNYTEAVGWPAHLQAAPHRKPNEDERAVLSRFELPDGRLQYIEPLTGIARHPFARVGCKWPTSVSSTSIFDLRYLLLADQCDATTHALSARRNLFFDLGAATGFHEMVESDTHGTGAGASLPIFLRLYERQCIKFDEIWAWEANRQRSFSRNPSLWWTHATPEQREKVHFTNHAIREGTISEVLAGNYSHPDSFLKVLLQQAHPRDFVVLKIDFDPGPEWEVALAVLNRPELRRLVDEVFWDNQFYFDGLEFGWHIRSIEEVPGSRDAGVPIRMDVDGALAVMSKFREAGIRSHFWV